MRKVIMGLGLVAYGAVFLAVGVYLHKNLGKPAPPAAQARDGKPRPASEGILESPFIRVAERVNPGVVNISIVSGRRVKPPTEMFRPFGNDPAFKDFFDRFFEGLPRGERQSSLGSGVIIDKAGHILTNHHVIKDADTITVKFVTKKELKGKVVGSDPRTDLAVLRVESKEDLPAVALGDSDSLKVGEWAIAIGNPFGLDHTVTVGVISATGRSDVGITSYENFIQTDAPINQGNSGGPLLNIRGEVVGINTAIVATGQGIGFAIPINLARKVVDDLIHKGKVSRGWLGVTTQALTTERATALGLKEGEGALVTQVMPKSPALAAGVKVGDIITSVDGKPAKDPRALNRLIAEAEVGKEVELKLFRDKRPLSLKAKLADPPA